MVLSLVLFLRVVYVKELKPFFRWEECLLYFFWVWFFVFFSFFCNYKTFIMVLAIYFIL